MKPPGRVSVAALWTRMLSPGRRPARVAAGLCPDVYVRWWCILRRRQDRLEWLVGRIVAVKDSESACVQEKRRVKAQSS
jgi:hypothetical protein